MSKQAKKRPKPAIRWGIYSKAGRFIGDEKTKQAATAYAWPSEGEFVHRVRIVPVVAKAKRRKGAK